MHPPTKSLRALASTTVAITALWLWTVAHAGQAIQVWTAPAMTRVTLTEKPGEEFSNRIAIYACRNEWESAQVIVRGTAKRLSMLSCKLEPLLSAQGKSLPEPVVSQEFDVRISHSSPDAPLAAGIYPDALVPLSGDESPTLASFRGEAGDVNLRLWIDCRVPSAQSPGEYSGKMLIRERESGEMLGSATITVHVLPETLPDKPSLKSYFGLEEHRIAGIHGLDREKDGVALARVMDDYYQLLIESRVQPGLLFASSPPIGSDGQLLWTVRASETLPAPSEIVGKYLRPGGGMNCLHLPMWRDYPFTDPLGDDRQDAVSYLAELARLTRSIPADATLFYSVGRLDEPNSAEDYECIRKWALLVKDAAKAADTQIKFFVTEQPQPEQADWGSLTGSVDIWAPQVMLAWEDLESNMGEVLIAERIEAGDDVWCYPALAQFREQWRTEKGKTDMERGSYPPVWLTDYPPVNYRILPWICAAHSLTGIHYWNVFEWNEDIDPWSDAGTFMIEDDTFNGDGLLIYPPAPASLVGHEKASAMQPCASIRLKWIRDGMEDYEHLQILKKSNPAAAAGILAGVALGFDNWEPSVARIDAFRNSISKALLKKISINLPSPPRKHENRNN